jgi:hypothetical protein
MLLAWLTKLGFRILPSGDGCMAGEVLGRLVLEVYELWPSIMALTPSTSSSDQTDAP